MTARTRVKICGITSVEDALLVVELGTDAIGFVFYDPSPRSVSIAQAREIAEAVPAFVTKTALFVNPEVDFVKSVLETVSIDLIQFHGDERPEFCEQFNRSYIKAIRMQDEIDLKHLAKQYASSCGLLLDAFVEGIPGGTGEQFDWSRIPMTLSKPIILAGGLNPENVASAIEHVSPWAVDVSGGLEASKGVKSAEKVEQFMQQVMSTIE